MMTEPITIALFVATWAMIIPLYHKIGCIGAKVDILMNHLNIIRKKGDIKNNGRV